MPNRLAGAAAGLALAGTSLALAGTSLVPAAAVTTARALPAISCRIHAVATFPGDGSPAAAAAALSACVSPGMVAGTGGGSGSLTISASGGIGVAGEPAAASLSLDAGISDSFGHTRSLSLEFSGPALFLSLIALPPPLPQAGVWSALLPAAGEQGAAALAIQCLNSTCTVDGSFVVA